MNGPIKVVLILCAAGAALYAATPTPAPVAITVAPATLQFTYSVTDTRLPAAQTVQLKANKTGLTYTVTVPVGARWLTVTPDTGAIP